MALRGELVVGFHTLMVLARLAVSRDEQGKGLGAGLLKDAIQRTLAAADIAGIRALAVHAKAEAVVPADPPADGGRPLHLDPNAAPRATSLTSHGQH